MHHAVDLIGFSNRALLKDMLGFVLANTLDEKTFDLYFRRDEFSDSIDPAPQVSSSH